MSGEILIVEDEPKLADLLIDYLKASGFEACCLGDGNGAVEWVRERNPELVLLDLMLPGREGMEICREIRTFSRVPIIMITARIEEIDRVLGLEMGADDYICKPFSPREVVARVKAVLRRTQDGRTVQAEFVELDDSRYKATLHGQDLGLTAVEFKLLQIMISSPGRIFGREQLIDRIYPDRRTVSGRTIDSHVKKLRRKIEALDPRAKIIHSVYGVGYKFELDPAR